MRETDKKAIKKEVMTNLYIIISTMTTHSCTVADIINDEDLRGIASVLSIVSHNIHEKTKNIS